MSANNKLSEIPEHVGLILDGNRRWAKDKGLPALEGHRAGYKNLETIGDAAWSRGVKYLSAYVFSTENWNRSKKEVDYLMDMLVSIVLGSKEINKLDKKGIKILFVGSKTNLPSKVLKAMKKAEAQTTNNTSGALALHFNYGGRQELVDAVKAIVEKGVSSGEIDKELISSNIYNSELPDADLIIRTSGEQRLSNFMMWRSAYSELYFTDKKWPEFTEADLEEALTEYASRQRRHGK